MTTDLLLKKMKSLQYSGGPTTCKRHSSGWSLPRRASRSVVGAILALLAGCASVPYQYGDGVAPDTRLALRPGEPQIERGRPNAFIDGLGHYVFSLPSKLILFNWKVDNHKISPETEAALRRYLEANNLTDVKVRINQYAPGDEWSRLVRNRAVNPFWRYTVGTLTTLFYTIFPGRLFGGDYYNPFTNTINIYSDHPAIVMHEAAHAKDFSAREQKGTYASARALPLVPLYQESIATGDTIGYDRDQRATEDEKEAYKVLYPAYGTYIADETINLASYFGPISLANRLAIEAAVVIPSHVIGRIKANSVEQNTSPPTPPNQQVDNGTNRDSAATAPAD